jgi:hypothetical protein
MKETKSKTRTSEDNNYKLPNTSLGTIQERFLEDVKSGVSLEDARKKMNQELEELEETESNH